MDELEIKIAIFYKIPENDLTFNGILHYTPWLTQLINFKQNKKHLSHEHFA